MADDERGTGNSNRWRYPTAALILLSAMGLGIYQAVRTGDIPYEIIGPLVCGALWALYGYRISGPGSK